MLLKCVQPVFTENDEAKQSGEKSMVLHKNSYGKNLSIKLC